MDDQKLSRTVVQIVAWLVKGDYDRLERLTNGARLNKRELLAAVTKYPATLVMPPDSAFEDLDVIEIEGRAPRRWGVRFDLWTAEEGRSDLSLELTLIEDNKDLYGVQIDNIHVL